MGKGDGAPRRPPDCMREGMRAASFLTGANAPFIAELYTRWLEAPDSVDPSWARFFAEIKDEAITAELRGPDWAPPRPRLIGNGAAARADGSAAATVAMPEIGDVQQAVVDSIRALTLIRSYRVRGHLEARLDPLGLEKREDHPDLDYRTYGFTEADLDRRIFIDNLLGLAHPTLREI